MNTSGFVHLYYGDGKGKTTAAIGLAVRAFGAGFDVLAVQFLKDGSSSEIAVLRDRLGIPVLAEQITSHMSNRMTDEEKELTRACHGRIWQKAMEWIDKIQFSIDIREPSAGRILILDEILGAIEAGLFPEDELLAFLDHRAPDLEVVLTGRNPSPAVMERADYRSQIVCEGHPYNSRIGARKGIEF